jgi:hypothetical protein
LPARRRAILSHGQGELICVQVSDRLSYRGEALLESPMRLATLVTALAIVTPAAAQDVKISPKIDFGAQSSSARAKAKPSLSPEDEKKLGAAMEAKRKAADDSKEKAWDARMKRIMGGICRGC